MKSRLKNSFWPDYKLYIGRRILIKLEKSFWNKMVQIMHVFLYIALLRFLDSSRHFFQYLVNFILIISLFLDHCVLNCNMITLKWRNFFLILCSYIPWFFIKTHAEWMKCFASSSSSCGLKSQIRSTFSIWTTMEKGNLTTLQLHSNQLYYRTLWACIKSSIDFYLQLLNCIGQYQSTVQKLC